MIVVESAQHTAERIQTEQTEHNTTVAVVTAVVSPRLWLGAAYNPFMFTSFANFKTLPSVV